MIDWLSFVAGFLAAFAVMFVVAILRAIRSGQADAYEDDWMREFRRKERERMTADEVVEAYREMVRRHGPECEIVQLRRGFKGKR